MRADGQAQLPRPDQRQHRDRRDEHEGKLRGPPGTTDTYPLCHASSFDIPVTVTGNTVSVLWSQLTDGVPVDVVNGTDVVGLEWAFDGHPPRLARRPAPVALQAAAPAERAPARAVARAAGER